MTAINLLKKAKSCVFVKEPKLKKPGKFGYSLDLNPSNNSFDSAILRSAEDLTALPSMPTIRNISSMRNMRSMRNMQSVRDMQSMQDMRSMRDMLAEEPSIEQSDSENELTPPTRPVTRARDSDELIARINEVIESPASTHQSINSAPNDVYLPPKVTGRPPSLGALRPVSPFYFDFINDEDDATVYERDSALGDSLKTIVTDHAALEDLNASPEKRNVDGNLSLFPPVLPNANSAVVRHAPSHIPLLVQPIKVKGKSGIHRSLFHRKKKAEPSGCWDAHPAFGKGGRMPREAGRAPTEVEVKKEGRFGFQRLLRRKPGKEDLRKSNEEVSAHGNETFAYFRG